MSAELDPIAWLVRDFGTDPAIVVDNTITPVQSAMFPYPEDSGAPVVAGGNYFKQWWQQHVRHR